MILWKTALRVLAYGYIIGIILWTLPGPPDNMKIGIQDISTADKIRNFPAYLLYWNKIYIQHSKLKDILRVTGTHQNWNMFAPNPIQQDTWVDANVKLADESAVNLLYPRGSQMGYVERFIKERYRKFIETAHLDDNGFLWPTLANYMARLQYAKTPDNPPVFLTLKRHTRPVMPPGVPQPTDFYEFVFFETPISLERLTAN